MTLSYSTSTVPGSLRTVHTIVVDGNKLETTRKIEVLPFARPLVLDKSIWSELKEAVRLEKPFEVKEGTLKSLNMTNTQLKEALIDAELADEFNSATAYRILKSAVMEALNINYTELNAWVLDQEEDIEKGK